MKQKLTTTSRRNFIASAGVLSAGLFISPKILFQEQSPVTLIINEAAKSPVTVQKLRNNISVLDGSGGNIAVFTGKDGKLMIDAGIDVSKAKIKKILADLSDDHVKYLVNTHWHFDHASGNGWIHDDGAIIIAHAKTKTNLAKQIRVEDWNYSFPPSPKGSLPTVVFEQEKTLEMNGEIIKMNYYGPAHTDCDISVYFQNADVLHVGDTWWNGYYPFIDFNTNGNIDGMLRAANANVKLATNKTIIIPGHGPVGDKTQLISYRDMLQDVRTQIAALKREGNSLSQVIAAKPTRKYDAQWGNFVINGDFFANLVYRSV